MTKEEKQIYRCLKAEMQAISKLDKNGDVVTFIFSSKWFYLSHCFEDLALEGF